MECRVYNLYAYVKLDLVASSKKNCPPTFTFCSVVKGA